MVFEKKTYCAEWKVLMAKIAKYVDGIPCIDLVDTTTEKVFLITHLGYTGLTSCTLLNT